MRRAEIIEAEKQKKDIRTVKLPSTVNGGAPQKTSSSPEHNAAAASNNKSTSSSDNTSVPAKWVQTLSW